jgi:hypothetical protein
MKPASKKTTGAADEPAAKAEQTKKKTVAKKAKSPADEQPIAAVAKAPPKAAKTAKATKPSTPVKAADAKPKATKQKAVVTAAPAAPTAGEIRLVAHVDVGLGNTLFFRGWGGGLRWDTGTPAVCMGEGRWELTLNKVTEPVHFKVLINDEVWSDGPDLTAIPSGMLEFNPAFG